jgi:hypothetical protein
MSQWIFTDDIDFQQFSMLSKFYHHAMYQQTLKQLSSFLTS